MTTRRRLLIDDRWRGDAGIARFAAEVIPRLGIPWSRLGGVASPTSPADVFNPRRLVLRASDVVYSPGFNAGITRARQLLTIHDLIHLEDPGETSAAKRIYYERVVRPAAYRAGAVMTVSSTSARSIERWLGSSEVEVIPVGDGCSAAFTPDGPRAHFDRPTFVYLGSAVKSHKNFDVLLEAFASSPDFGLVVITGDRTAVDKKIAGSGLGDRVSVLSHVTDAELAAIYRGASGCLMPSRFEGFGLPALEAMSSGTRVAYWSGCESIAEICAGEGTVVPSVDDSGAWAEALGRMADDGSPLVMSAAWHARYSWDEVAVRVRNVLSSAL